ncbi:MAG: COG1615 family transporter [Clostridia bacterium]|nr:COG1615 family transporter [Clostridia bacterium]
MKNKISSKISNKKRLFAVLGVFLLAIIISYILFRASYLEMLEIGENYTQVYWQNIKYMSVTLIGNFTLIYIMIYTTNRSIKKGLKEFFEQENKKMPKFINKSIAFISAIIISACTSSFILEKAMLCFNSAQFGINDPIFGIDIGYFVFQKPFIELVFWYFIILEIALLLYKTVYYITTFNLFFDGVDKKAVKNSKLIKQITNGILVLAILLAGLILLEVQDIGTSKFITLRDESTSYSLFGAGFVDVNIKVWGYRILSVIIVISVYMGIKAFKQDKTKKLIIWIAVVPTYLVALFIVMASTQGIYVNANEYDKEKEYISENIKATKEAYGVNIEEIALNELETITSKHVIDYKNVLNNIAVADSNIVLKDLNNGQTAKGYYSYRTSQIGNYNINGRNNLVYISPREIVNSTGTYNSKTYEHTHGYGVIVTSATETKENGNLNNMQKDFQNDISEVIPISEPRIYYGLETNDTVVTNSGSNKEFDYPILNSSSVENKENEYDGKSGLNLNLLDRIILAIKEKDIKLAFSR